MTAYMDRTASRLITYDPVDVSNFNYVYAGSGMDYQLSYVFPSNYEIIGCFSSQKVKEEIKVFTPNVDQYSLGLTRYLWEHTFKLQGEVTYSTLNYYNNTTLNNWYLRVQVEIGI